jgi:zinc/manganese transport system substrate-binding protein
MARTPSDAESKMKNILRLLLIAVTALASSTAAAALNVFACEPEWAALARELGGDLVSVSSATTARQDVHHIEARPSLIARARRADLLICSGAGLEVGWLPLLLSQSGNARIQPGSPGYVEASQYVLKLEVPRVIDRALGDIHPAGNPHVHTDPRNIAKVAEVLAARLMEIDRANAAAYRKRTDAFLSRWQAAIARWEQQGARLKGVPIVVYHKDFSYFIHWMGMREVGSLEPRPGIPPTPSHLADLVEQMKRSPAKVIVYAPYNSERPAQFLSGKTQIPATLLPYTVGGTDKAKDLFGLFDDTIERLLGTLK